MNLFDHGFDWAVQTGDLIGRFVQRVFPTVVQAVNTTLEVTRRGIQIAGRWVNVFCLPLMWGSYNLAKYVMSNNTLARLINYCLTTTNYNAFIPLRAVKASLDPANSPFVDFAIGFLKWVIYLFSIGEYFSNLCTIIIPCFVACAFWCFIRDWVMHWGEVIA